MKYKLYILFFVLSGLKSFSQYKVLPANAPVNFGKLFLKIIDESGKEYGGIIGKEKSFTQNSEHKQYISKECLPLADSCFLFEEINDDFDVFYVFEAVYGLYKDKETALKAFRNLLGYINSDPSLKKTLKAEELEDSEEEVVQLYLYNHGSTGTTIISIVLEANDAYHPDLDQELELWKLYVNVSEDFSN